MDFKNAKKIRHLVHNCPIRQASNLANGLNTKKCFHCGDADHLKKDCPFKDDPEMGLIEGVLSGALKECHYCGSPDHLLKDCPDKPRGDCFECGGPHLAAQCPERKEREGKNSGPKCHNCGTFKTPHLTMGIEKEPGRGRWPLKNPKIKSGIS